MQIQIFTQHYAPEITAARFRIEAFAERFASRGHRVEVVCPAPSQPRGVVPREFRGRLLTRRELDGVAVDYTWVRASPSKSKSARLAYYGSYAAAATAAGMGRPRPDLVLASSPPLTVGVPAAAVASARRLPLILDVRDLWPKAAVLMGELGPGRAVAAAERLERLLYRRASRVVTVSPPFVDEIAAAGGAGKTVLIPNGTTAEWLEAGALEPDRGSLDIPARSFVWTYAGNLGPSRRLDVAIEAARELGAGFQLLIIGDGGARAELERQAAELPRDRVRFAGALDATRTAKHLRASDLSYVPQQRSLGDFIPSKLYDCAAVGPMVVGAVGETRRLAEAAGIGLVVDPDSAAELAAAVKRIAGDPALAAELEARGRAFAHEHQREEQADRLVTIAEELVAERSGPGPPRARRGL